jgi:hypothetical protein
MLVVEEVLLKVVLPVLVVLVAAVMPLRLQLAKLATPIQAVEAVEVAVHPAITEATAAPAS